MIGDRNRERKQEGGLRERGGSTHFFHLLGPPLNDTQEWHGKAGGSSTWGGYYGKGWGGGNYGKGKGKGSKGWSSGGKGKGGKGRWHPYGRPWWEEETNPEQDHHKHRLAGVREVTYRY